MKKILFIILIGFTGFMQAQTVIDFPVLKGEYLGQPLPGDIPLVFARGIISTDNLEHSAPIFSPDGAEVFWSLVQRPEVKGVNGKLTMSMKQVNEHWTSPTVVNELPAFTPDGTQHFFIPKLSLSNNNKTNVTKNDRLYKLNEICLLERFPELKYTRTLSIASNRTIYFMSHLEGPLNGYGIYRAELVNGKYTDPEPLPFSINKLDCLNWTPFISPDESYLLFSSNRHDPENDAGDLYISFHMSDGSWSEPLNIGAPVNTIEQERFPTISPDGRYLFFTRPTPGHGQDVYWVSTGIIEKLKEKAIQEGHLKQQNEKQEIHEAVDQGNLKKVQELIEADTILLEAKDENGATPLIRACINRFTMARQSEIAKFLVSRGADVNAVDDFNIAPLIGACVGYGPDYNLIKHLIAKGAEVNVMGTNGITPIHWAAFYGNLEVAKLLIDSGADVNFYDNYTGSVEASSISGTVLQVAINSSSASEELVKLIIESGANLNRTDSQGNTELHLAALKGKTNLTELLVHHGADVNATNKFNRTALYYAAKHGYHNVAEILIAAGAKQNTISETNYGKAPQLTETLEDGEAYIWSLGGSAYAVKTANNLVVFTDGNKIDESPEAGLINGHLNPSELTGQNITIFVNHMDRWQMGAKDFGQQAKLLAGIELVSSFNPDFSKEENSDIPVYRLAQPNETFSVGEIQVHTIPALASGLGYLIEVDGVKIFNAGLHIGGKEASEVEVYRKEIDFLKPFGPIDIVMLTVHSHSNSVGMDHSNHLYLLDQLEPKAIYMFGANIPETYSECANVLQARNIPMMYPEVKQANGERYHYLRDETQK